MIFDNGWILYFLSLYIVFIPAMIVRYRKNRIKAMLFAAAAQAKERVSLLRELRLRLIISDIFFLLFTGFLIIALAGPRWGMRIVADYRRGVDVVLAFDLSRSMNVRDCPPFRFTAAFLEDEAISRLERGIGIAGELTAAIDDVRTGAVIGKGRGIIAVPLTYDTETMLTFIYSLDSQAVTGSGTNLESLIDSACDAFHDSFPTRKAIILFSDGEELSGSVQVAVERLRRAGISLSVVGLGSDQGGPVPAGHSQGNIPGEGGFLLDEDHRPVISVRQSGVLLNAAERTGGIYVGGSRADTANALIEYISSLSAESRLSGHRREANPRWRIFILAALASLGGSRILSFTRRRAVTGGGSAGKKSAKALSALFCLFLFTSCERTQGRLLIMEGNFFSTRGYYTEAILSYMKALDFDEAVPYAEYGLGTVYYALEESEGSYDRYRAADDSIPETGRTDHSELRYRIFYNTGIIYFENGEYEEAAEAFREALKIDGSRIEAKRNLEISLLTLSRMPAPQASSSAERSEGSGVGATGTIIFNYLREKEQEQWKSREWTGEDDFSGPDY